MLGKLLDGWLVYIYSEWPISFPGLSQINGKQFGKKHPKSKKKITTVGELERSGSMLLLIDFGLSDDTFATKTRKGLSNIKC